MRRSWNGSLVPRPRSATQRTRQIPVLSCRYVEPPIGVEPMTYALRGCHCVAHGLEARASFKFARCYWCLSLAVDGRSGASRGHVSAMRRPGSRWSGAFERPSALQAGHISIWRKSCERYALPPGAGARPAAAGPWCAAGAGATGISSPSSAFPGLRRRECSAPTDGSAWLTECVRVRVEVRPP